MRRSTVSLFSTTAPPQFSQRPYFILSFIFCIDCDDPEFHKLCKSTNQKQPAFIQGRTRNYIPCAARVSGHFLHQLPLKHRISQIQWPKTIYLCLLYRVLSHLIVAIAHGGLDPRNDSHILYLSSSAAITLILPKIATTSLI